MSAIEGALSVRTRMQRAIRSQSPSLITYPKMSAMKDALLARMQMQRAIWSKSLLITYPKMSAIKGALSAKTRMQRAIRSQSSSLIGFFGNPLRPKCRIAAITNIASPQKLNVREKRSHLHIDVEFWQNTGTAQE